jgi:hypothetical protein
MPMTESAAYAYMQARIQARHGDRLMRDQWRQLDTCRDLGRFLQIARVGALGQWTQHFTAQEDPAQWEMSLRSDWRANLSQLTDWLPDRWRPAMHFLQSLPALPAIAHLLNGEPPTAWMSTDPFLMQFDLADAETFRASVQSSDRSALMEYWNQEHPAESWLNAWRTTWPATDRENARRLETICREVAASWNGAEADYWQWHDRLERIFTGLLRRQPRSILAMLGHVGLVSLDMLHLRAGLMRLYVTSERTP